MSRKTELQKLIEEQKAELEADLKLPVGDDPDEEEPEQIEEDEMTGDYEDEL